jgi:hypothetical protein
MMRMIEVDVPMHAPTFEMARHLALEIAHANQMENPMIVSWHSQRDRAVSPAFAGGGHPEAWWEKFGRGNRGELEISVSSTYDFVLTDSRDYETLDEMSLLDLTDSQGNSYICYSSLLGGSRTPNTSACVPTDEWLAKQT